MFSVKVAFGMMAVATAIPAGASEIRVCSGGRCSIHNTTTGVVTPEVLSEQQGRGSLRPVMSLEQAQQQAREAIQAREREARQPPVRTKQWWEDEPALNLAVNGGTAFKTRRGSVLCVLPSSLKEADSASGDRAWLKQIGCVQMDEATPVRVVDKIGDLLNGFMASAADREGRHLMGVLESFRSPFLKCVK